MPRRRPQTQAEVISRDISTLLRSTGEPRDSHWWLTLAKLYTDLAFASVPASPDDETTVKELLTLAIGSRNTAEWLVELADVLEQRPADAETVLGEVGLRRLTVRDFERDIGRYLAKKLAVRCATAAAYMEQSTTV
jgi:hypothetical protein